MSNTHEFKVKIQLQGGITTTTIIHAQTYYKARQLVKMQHGSELVSINYVRKID
jgi:hypothetical protein